MNQAVIIEGTEYHAGSIGREHIGKAATLSIHRTINGRPVNMDIKGRIVATNQQACGACFRSN